MKYTIIHASRSRPKLAFQTYLNWVQNATNPTEIEYIISIDNDDVYKTEYKNLFLNVKIIYNYGFNKNAVKAINKAARFSKGEIIIVTSDDFNCELGWDESILKVINGKHKFLLKTYDGIQDWLVTLPIMDRDYYNLFGYIYYPGYRHMFCDTELTCVADLLNCKITSHLHFKHDHFSIKEQAEDKTTIKANKTWLQGEELFRNRIRMNFFLSQELIKGSIQNQDFTKYFKSEKELTSLTDVLQKIKSKLFKF